MPPPGASDGPTFEQMMVSNKPFKNIQIFSSARVRSGSHKLGPLFLQTIRFFLHHLSHAFPGTLSPRFAQNSDHSGTGNGPNCVQLDDTIPLGSDSVIDRNAIGGGLEDGTQRVCGFGCLARALGR